MNRLEVVFVQILTLIALIAGGCVGIRANKAANRDIASDRASEVLLRLASLPDPGPALVESVEERKERTVYGCCSIARKYTIEEIRSAIETSAKNNVWRTDFAMDEKVYLLCRILFEFPCDGVSPTNQLGIVSAWWECNPLRVRSDGETWLTSPVIVSPWLSGPRYNSLEYFEKVRKAFGERKTKCYPAEIKQRDRGARPKAPIRTGVE